jgi:Na+-translocating ferredoxin:NAD+ oxidoreductase subunit B
MLAVLYLILLLAIVLLAYPAMQKRLEETPRSKPQRAATSSLSILLIVLCLYALFAATVPKLLLLGLLFVALLRFLYLSFDKKNTAPLNQENLVEQINALLPQTQCGQCDFPGCKPYATAIAEGKADINQCPPGGDAGIKVLARLLQRDIKPLNSAHGVIKPTTLAIIREPECIGCTKCIQACPVDAIIGAPKLMHTIIADLCTGCELCIPPCPMDCIDLIALTDNQQVAATSP